MKKLFIVLVLVAVAYACWKLLIHLLAGAGWGPNG